MWPYLLAAGASIAGGYISASTSRKNAEFAQEAANMNAYYQQQAGNYNANMTSMLGTFNAGLAAAGGRANAIMAMWAGDYNAALTTKEGQLNADFIKRVGTYNAMLQRTIAEHNASLLEEEIDIVWDAAELDIMQLEMAQGRTVGEAEAYFAASGVVMGQDSAADVVTDINTQFELDKTIVRHGADIQATRYLNAAAGSRWEGAAEAQRIMHEADMGVYQTLTNAQLRAKGIKTNAALEARGIITNAALQSAGILGQSWIDSSTIRYNANMQAYSTRYGGWAANAQAQNTAGQQIIGGYLGAIGAGATLYGAKSLATTGGTNPAYTAYRRGPTLSDPGGSLLGTSYK